MIRCCATPVGSVGKVFLTFKVFHVNPRHLNVVVVVVATHVGFAARLLLTLPQLPALKEVLGRVLQAEHTLFQLATERETDRQTKREREREGEREGERERERRRQTMRGRERERERERQREGEREREKETDKERERKRERQREREREEESNFLI